MTGTAAPVVIIGAGIIGVSIGWELARRGLDVMLLDRGEPGRGASFGNVASIAVSEFMPASRPSMWRQLPGWLLHPEGPVRFRPGYLPRLLPWFARFAAASTPARVRALEAAGAALCGRVYDDLLPLLEAAGLSHMLTEEGCLSLYADEAAFRADREHLEVIERYGIPHEVLDAPRLRSLEPAIGPAITRAVLLPANRSIRDPYRLVVGLAAQLRARGGRIETGEAVGIEGAGGTATAVRLADGRRLPAAAVVIAAGAHSGPLSRLIGEPVPVETERGYHTQLMAPGIALRHALIWPARAFMITPTAGGIRVGGTVEMAGLDAPPDFRRARVLVGHARAVLPGLSAEGGKEWMGHRPATPDTVPVIGPSARTRGLWFATGHGHLGLTLSATTARLLADMLTGATLPLDMTPYRADRF